MLPGKGFVTQSAVMLGLGALHVACAMQLARTCAHTRMHDQRKHTCTQRCMHSHTHTSTHTHTHLLAGQVCCKEAVRKGALHANGG